MCGCVWVIGTDDRSELGDVFVLPLCVDVDMGEYRFEAFAALALENAVGEPFNEAYGCDNPLLLLLGDAAAMRYDRWRYKSVGDNVPDELNGEPREDDKYGWKPEGVGDDNAAEL